MARLAIESLEGRDMPSAGALAEAAGFTPPIGSNKGSLVGVADARVVVAGEAQTAGRVASYIEQDNLFKQYN